MITLEDWIMIRHMHNQGVPKVRIAKELGLDRKTVSKAISEGEHPESERQSRGSILDPYKDYWEFSKGRRKTHDPLTINEK